MLQFNLYNMISISDCFIPLFTIINNIKALKCINKHFNCLIFGLNVIYLFKNFFKVLNILINGGIVETLFFFINTWGCEDHGKKDIIR